MELRQLTPNEVLFIGGETANTYQHTSGLTVLDARDRPGFGYDTFRRNLEERIGSVPHFRWKLHEVPFGLDLPYWVEDEQFDFDHHVRRIAVPAPGDRRSLAELVAYLYSRHLDRSRPLWESWFIEGLPDGRYAFFTKLHHCMMDGEGASRLGELTCDFEPDAAPREIDPSIRDARAGRRPAPWEESLTAGLRLAGLPLRAGREVLDAVGHTVRRRVADRDSGRTRPPVPMSIFNADVGRQRGFVYGSVSLADVKAVKSHFGVTVNDVVLALVAGSLRRYLLDRDRLPDEPLRTSIAVSLRTDGDEEFGNRITTAGVTLATDLEDPEERLAVIARDSEVAKQEARAGGKGLLELLAVMPPVLVGPLVAATPPELVPRTTGFNLMVSSVRGSTEWMYIGGARVEANYPMSIITRGSALNVTALSYVDTIDVGVTLAPEVVPDPWTIVDGLEVALDELRARLA